VAEKLAKEGISVEVVDLRTISPLDAETFLNSVAKTRRAVVVHEAVKNFGVGAEVAARIQEELFGQLKAPVRRVASVFCPVPFSKPLEAAFVPGQDQIEAAIRSTLG
jgi:pyruvate dehydrogenase E1 component beta subunit